MSEKVFTADLVDPNSQNFKNIKAEIEPLIQATFERASVNLGYGSMTQVNITGFRSGSVIAEYVVRVTYTNSTLSPNDVANHLQRNFNEQVTANNGALPNSNIRVDSITLSEQIAPTTTSPVPPEPFAEWKIAVICACILAFVAIVVAVAAACVR
uniref:SEA domain-containing protein n=1 Tax=Ciona savignyi TaxID=51511 RepID=H2YZQ7_CIOSA